MRKPIAFFDVDETLNHIKSMFSFRKFYFQSLSKATWEKEERKHQLEIEQHIKNGADRNTINSLFYKAFTNCRQDLFVSIIDEWYQKTNKEENFFVADTLRELRWHQEQENIVAFVSGSAAEILSPLAKELNVSHVLATNLEIKSGIYTGKIIPPQVIGNGKKILAQKLACQLQVELADCYAYGDHFSDLPLLEVVGNPHVVSIVSRDIRLLQHAAEKNGPYQGMISHELSISF